MKEVVLLALLILMGVTSGEEKKGRTLRPWEKACRGEKPKARGACGISCASATGEWLTMECSSLSTISRKGCRGCNETMSCFQIPEEGEEADCLNPMISTVGQHNATELGIPPKYDRFLKECVPMEWTCPDQVRKVFFFLFNLMPSYVFRIGTAKTPVSTPVILTPMPTTVSAK